MKKSLQYCERVARLAPDSIRMKEWLEKKRLSAIAAESSIERSVYQAEHDVHISRVRDLLAESLITVAQRAALDRMLVWLEGSSTASLGPPFLERLDRIDTYLLMRRRGLPDRQLSSEAIRRFKAKGALAAHAAKDRKALRPNWMSDPNELPKKPPTSSRSREDES